MGSRLFAVNLVKLIISACFITKDACASTLTTAVVRASTSPKPSTIYRRINVNTELQSQPPIQVFDIVDTRRRNSRKRDRKNNDYEIWSWDQWCSLQPRVGSCDKKIDRFYYDRLLEECVQFTYSGCDGNKNNFATKLECERRCLGATSMMRPDSDRPLVCFLQPDIGRCLAYATQYFFDLNANMCRKFVYGGCGGNGNRFNTVFECMKTCKGAAG